MSGLDDYNPNGRVLTEEERLRLGGGLSGYNPSGKQLTDDERARIGGADNTVRTSNKAGDALMDAADWASGALKDTFSAEQVSAPEKGQWGTEGTQAAEQYGRAVQQGQAARTQYANQAAQAGKVAAAGADETVQRAATIGERQTPVTNYGNANRVNTGNEQTLAALNQFAANQDGPSGAQAQLTQATQQGLANQLAMARSGRGFGGNSAAMGQAQGGMAQLAGNAANESAALKAREFASARERQLSALNAAMGGGLGLGQQYGGQSQFQTQAQLQSQAQNDAAALGQSRLGLDYQRFGTDAGLGYGQLGEETNLNQLELGQHALDQQAEYELAQQRMALDAQKANQNADLEKDSGIGGMLTAAAGALFSDERSKEKIERLEGALSSSLALDTVKGAPAYSYNYKDPSQPGAKPGRMVGPMAQDLERGPLGNTVVKDTPQGKMVDSGRLTMVNTSAIAEQQKQLDALKRAMRGKAA